MKKAKISEAKNHFSGLIEAVKHGESILILDRDTPVARLEPVGAETAGIRGRLATLLKRGSITPPRKKLDMEAFLGREMARTTRGGSGVKALLDEREEGR